MPELSSETLEQLASLIADRIAEKLRIPDPVLNRATDGELTRVKFGTRTVFQVSELQELIARKSENVR
jgi:hypothetical protein